MKRAHLIRNVLLILFALAVLGLGVSVFMSQNVLSVTRYEYSNEKITVPFKIVQLTDLHNHEFGKSNSRLVKKIAAEQPDVIFMTGDMLNDDENDTEVIANLIKELNTIATVYFSLGNHEIDYIKENEDLNLIQVLEEAGAIVLEEDYLDTEIKGQKVRIGGLYGYTLSPKYGNSPEQKFMEKFEDTDSFKILLSHIPEGLLLWKGMQRWDVDLVFSGHVHGGQVRLPFVGGLFSPEEKFFPTYTKGKFTCGNGTMILSAGLGSSGSIPRINNLPEIAVCQVNGN